MARHVTSPGQAAHQAFDTGLRCAIVVGLAGIGLLYWADVLTLFGVGFTLVVLFPTYLLVAAAVLSKWLGLDKGAEDLERVTRRQQRNRWRQ